MSNKNCKNKANNNAKEANDQQLYVNKADNKADNKTENKNGSNASNSKNCKNCK